VCDATISNLTQIFDFAPLLPYTRCSKHYSVPPLLQGVCLHQKVTFFF
jgi:hypothetical protein